MPQTPAAAYRADMRDRGEPFGPHDSQWIAAATSLHLAAASRGRLSPDHLYDAIGIAIDVLGDERIEDFVVREWAGDHTYVEALVIFADDIHFAGALNLAGQMFDDLLRAAPDIAPVHRGRVLALRARVEWKRGHLDEASERYGFVASLAREANSPELEARAELGFSSMAQMTGNMPAVRAHSTRVVEIAREHGLARLEAVGLWGLMMTESKADNTDAAIHAGLEALALVHDDDLLRVGTLHNIGQVLLEHGHPALARAAFSALMPISAPPRSVVPALGGLALSAAQSGLEPTVEWAVREVWRARGLRHVDYEVAEALLEAGDALRIIGREEEWRPFVEAARALAEERRYNELQFRADRALSAAAPTPAAAPAAPGAALSSASVERIAALEPERLPARLSFGTSPA